MEKPKPTNTESEAWTLPSARNKRSRACIVPIELDVVGSRSLDDPLDDAERSGLEKLGGHGLVEAIDSGLLRRIRDHQGNCFLIFPHDARNGNTR